MRNKITFKLFLSFAVALLIFSLVVGSGFAYLFREHTINIKKQDLEERAVKIAQALGDSRDQMMAWQEKENSAIQKGEGTQKQGRQMGMGPDGKPSARLQGPMGLGFNSVLRFLGSAAAEDVWIVDADQNLEMPSHRDGKKPAFMYKDLPPDAEKVVRKVMHAGDIGSSLKSHQLNLMYQFNPNVAAFAGYVHNRVEADAKTGGTVSDTENGYQVGVLGRIAIAKRTSAWASVGVGNKITAYEIGVGYDLTKNFDVNLFYNDTKYKGMDGADFKTHNVNLGVTYHF